VDGLPVHAGVPLAAAERPGVEIVVVRKVDDGQPR
jgi:hypothetical protein